MIIIYITIFLLIISFSAKGIKDTLSFHYWKTKFKNHQFWNPAISYMNKYKYKPKWLFKGPLVFLTDGWHLMQFIELNSIIIALSINIASGLFSIIVTFIVIRLLYSIFFNLFYK